MLHDCYALFAQIEQPVYNFLINIFLSQLVNRGQISNTSTIFSYILDNIFNNNFDNTLNTFNTFNTLDNLNLFRYARQLSKTLFEAVAIVAVMASVALYIEPCHYAQKQDAHPEDSFAQICNNASLIVKHHIDSWVQHNHNTKHNHSPRPELFSRLHADYRSSLAAQPASRLHNHQTSLQCNNPHNSPHNYSPSNWHSKSKWNQNSRPATLSKTFTRYVIVHTSTVTFKGRRSDYKAPYAPIATPNYCDPNLFPAVPRPPPPGSTPEGLMGTMSMITETFTIEGQSLTAEFPVPLFTAIAHVPVTTFITTDKNPSVVFPSDPIPNYSQTWPAGGGDGVHTPADGGASAPVSDAPSYTITAGPTSVVINTQTFTVTPGSSTIVTANDGGVFTIDPTAVIGQGVNVSRPPSVMGPSSSVLDGIPVTSAGPSLEIGGGAFPIPTSDPNTVRVNGKAVTINPTGVTIGGESMGFMKPAPSDVIVAGGEMLTAIGRSVVVLHSITYTYGNGIAPVVQVVNGDTVAIGPTGVLVHGSTLGGVSAQPTDTEFEIVGGATIAKIPPSMVIVNGETYAVGPGATMKTVVIGDQTLTMGPIGLVMASTTMRFPFDASVTTTIPGRSTGESIPQETGGKGEEDVAYSLRPDIRVGLTCLCIIFSVLVLG